MSADALPGTLDVIGPDTFARNGYPHAAWKRLRQEAPIHWFALPGGVGFWAVTKRADIVWVSKQPGRFLNGPRLAIFEEGAPVEGERRLARHLLNMDPPGHASYRKLTSQTFTPRAIRRMQDEIERITAERLDAIAGDAQELDFVEKVSAPIPLAVLADLLGAPREDWELLFRWTNQTVGSGDPEYQGDADSGREAADTARMELFRYFHELAEAHGYSEGLLRIAVKAALHCGLHSVEILVLQSA